jgi:hypothetical protein
MCRYSHNLSAKYLCIYACMCVDVGMFIDMCYIQIICVTYIQIIYSSMSKYSFTHVCINI